MKTRTNRTAFSLVELVIVIVIIGIIAAIAVPRISRGAAGAGAASLRADLHVMRSALDMYAAEHDSTYPAVGTIAEELTGYTDDQGNVSPGGVRDTTYKYGPYLVAIPVLKVGDEKGESDVAALAAGGIAWIYNDTTGVISANAGPSAADESGVLFKDY